MMKDASNSREVGIFDTSAGARAAGRSRSPRAPRAKGRAPSLHGSGPGACLPAGRAAPYAARASLGTTLANPDRGRPP